MQIKLKLTINQFEENRKNRRRKQPRKSWTGTVTIPQKEKPTEATLKNIGGGGDLSVRLFWNIDKEIFCAARNGSGVRFILKTETAEGNPLSKFKVIGQNWLKGKFMSWSAHMERK